MTNGTYDIIQYSGATIGHATGTTYNTASLPRWDGTSDPPAPQVANNKGYDVTVPEYRADVREAIYRQANGSLCDGTYWWPLFISNLGIDIALAGSTGQAQLTRDFYPHNFVQPNFAVDGQSIDQRDYGSLTDFVHYMQRNSVLPGSAGTLVQLYVQNRAVVDGNRAGGYGVTLNGHFLPNQNVRGSHMDILCLGYINSMARQHTKWVYAPTYSFQFIVAEMVSGPYQEDMVQVQQQQNWIDVVQSTQTFQPDLNQNKKFLDWAAANSTNVINAGQG